MVFACIHIVSLNILIVQICSEHHAIHEDLVGYARVRHFNMPSVNKKRRSQWIAYLGHDPSLEFQRSEVGPSGGIQNTESANTVPIHIDASTEVKEALDKMLPELTRRQEKKN